MKAISVAGPARLPRHLLDQLFEAIRDEGFEPTLEEAEMKSLDLPSIDILLWTRDQLSTPVATALATAVGHKIGDWRAKYEIETGAIPVVRVVYMPSGSVLARVPVS